MIEHSAHASRRRSHVSKPVRARVTRPLDVLVVGRGVVPVRVGCGGAELAMFQLAKAVALAGHRVTLVADVVVADFPTVPELRVVAPSGRLLGLVARLPNGFAGWVVKHFAGNLASALCARRLLRREVFDLVHAHGNLGALLLSRFTRTPIVYTEHDSTPWSCRYRNRYERVLRRAIYRVVNVRVFRRVTAVATTSEPLRVELVTRFGVDAERTKTILNGADLDVFNSTAADDALPRLPFARFCLFVGRLTPRKAADLLLRALLEAPLVNCVFAGDGPERKKLERLAESLGVAERVLFLGDASPGVLAPLYARADLLVIPSFSETTPLVAFEAMACGTPVLCSRVAGLPDVVDDWATGFLVKPGDIGQMAIAMRFLTADPVALTRMGDEAQKRVRKRFLWPNVARQYLELYHSLVVDGANVAAAPDELLDEAPRTTVAVA
jgi:glycosyltransferase involved in cell wall biosynthesis